MKISIKIISFLLFSLFLIPLIGTAKGEKIPSYVGIREGQTIIWNAEFDDDPFRDYYEDLGLSEDKIDFAIDNMFDGALDTDVEAWKFVILEIKEEKEYGHGSNETDGVPYLYNFYITEDKAANDWDDEEKNKRGIIYDYNVDFYMGSTYLTLGFSRYSFVDKKVDWDEFADELDEEYEDHNIEATAKDEERLYFFTEVECGISTSWEPQNNSEMEEFETISRFNSDGIMLYYEASYDGDVFIKFELEGAYFYEHWWWMLLIGVAVAGLVVVVMIILKRRKDTP